MSPEAVPHDDVRIERDFLSRLVSLAEHDAPSALAVDALALVAERAGATKAYLQIGESVAEPDWTASIGFDEAKVADVRRFLSTTIMQEALSSGESVRTKSAATDSRFRDAQSVQNNRIDEVLCVPIGTPAVGLVYLQGHVGGSRFPSDTLAWAERFARYLAPVARRLVTLAAASQADPTAVHRKRLVDSEVLVGKSPALANAMRLAVAVAPFDVPVLITGPSGTGKSELARIIQRTGPRRAAPFIELNCAALQDTLIESELFGALPGSHSTALQKQVGKVELAHGGTLFLDEVAELSPSAQAKLLQLLQERVYWPLGAKEPTTADVRIIAATNADLAQRVAERRFRQDLYYRLHVMAVPMPGLEERRGDIPLLAAHLLAQQSELYGFGPLTLSLAARQALMVADWPGNVRELNNAVTRAAICAYADGASLIQREHCFPGQGPATRGPVLWQDAVRDFQRQLLKDAIASEGSVKAAAASLGIGRSYAFELMRTLGLRAQ